ARDLIEGRLRDVEVAALDELGHLPVEEGQQQGPDVAAVHVGVRHQDDAVIAGLVRLVVLLADARAQRGDERDDLRAGEHLLEAGLLHVQDLAAQREDCLVATIAALLGTAACAVTLDDVQLALRGITALTVGELAGESAALEHPLAADRLPGLAGGEAGAAGVTDLGDDLLRRARGLLEEDRQLLVHHLLDQPLHLAVAELGLGLALELGAGDLHADHRRKAFARVVAGGGLLEILPELRLLRVAVDGAGERGLEAGQVGATLVGVDVVGEGDDALVVAIVPLQRDVQRHALAARREEDRLLVQHGLRAVEELHEARDAAVELEVVLLAGALVLQLDAQAGIEERELTQALGERVEGELEQIHDFGVGPEADAGPGAIGGSRRAHHAVGDGLGGGLLVDLSCPAHADLEPLREEVHAGHAHAVQAAGDLVATRAELAAGVQLGEHHVQRVLAAELRVRVRTDGDAAAIVFHGEAAVRVDGDRDLRAVTGERLVHRVVDHLVDELVE